MKDDHFRNYRRMTRRYEECSKALIDDLYRLLRGLPNLESGVEIFIATLYAHMFDVVSACLENHEKLAEFVVHKIASDTCNEIAFNTVSTIPWTWTRDNAFAHTLRHTIFNNVRHFMPIEAQAGVIGYLNRLSGSISDNVKEPLVRYYGDYVDAMRGNRPFAIPSASYDATVRYIQSQPPKVACLSETIARNAFHQSNLFAERNAFLRFPTPGFQEKRIPAQHLGEICAVVARHNVMEAVTAVYGQN